MAILQESNAKSQFHLFDLPVDAPLPPEGTFAATVIDIVDKFGVERKKYQSEELEKVNLTAFLFGFRDDAGTAHKIDSRPMKISANEKSALMEFLKGIMGKSPKLGWDYCELKGHKCLITVEHTAKGDRTYASIAAVSPVPAGWSAPAAAPVAKPKPKPQPAPAPAPAPAADLDSEIPF